MSAEALRNLRLNARDLGATSLARIPRSLTRICFMTINTNRAYRLGNGVTPLLRAIKLAELFKSFGYDVYYMANVHCVTFREYASMCLQRTKEHFFFLYIGQGGEPGPESLIFDDEPLPDEDFQQIFSANRAAGLKVTLMADFCAPGSIFEKLEAFDNNTVLISCSGTEAQLEEGADVFVDHFVRELNNRNEITNQQLFDSLRIVIKRHGLALGVTGEPKAILKEPVILWAPLIERNQLIR
jgi:hypothetical protein